MGHTFLLGILVVLLFVLGAIPFALFLVSKKTPKKNPDTQKQILFSTLLFLLLASFVSPLFFQFQTAKFEKNGTLKLKNAFQITLEKINSEEIATIQFFTERKKERRSDFLVLKTENGRILESVRLNENALSELTQKILENKNITQGEIFVDHPFYFWIQRIFQISLVIMLFVIGRKMKTIGKSENES